MATHRNYRIDFFGDRLSVTVTPTPSVISQWINDVVRNNNNNNNNNRTRRQPLVVGVGVQWTPFTIHDPPADTLQLCVGKRILIIQLSHCHRVPDNLRRFLTDPETIFVGVWNTQDAWKLARSSYRLQIGELCDIRYYVTDSEGWGLERCSFEVIVQECMGYQGVRLDPEISMSDWREYYLCNEQIYQASVDPFVCAQLGVWYRIWEA